MTHTPGPWSRNIKPASKYTTVWSGRNKHVAYIKSDSTLTEDEMEGNINLIAAAPELLSALKYAVQYAEKMEKALKCDIRNASLDNARAIIAKAEGR